MQAKDVMKAEVIALSPDTTVMEVARLMVEKEISGFPVVDGENHLLGAVSEHDLMYKGFKLEEPSVWQLCVWSALGSREIYDYKDSFRKLRSETAGEIMNAPAISVDESDDISKVGNLMFSHKIKRVFVTREGKLAGVISRSAFVKKLLEEATA
ncbi:MAG: CBS domain-containing protein [Schwartzia sp.]|nr:CBS domain-containing protein [Schwartzia sp. (in: firmicutes)]MBR1884827.1 CBS domain-containing protein [Schwartzia sp. (in: firmicutes)]